jgi:hypothetical protein
MSKILFERSEILLAEDARLRQPFVQVGLPETEWARLKDLLVAVHYLFEMNCVVDRKNTHCALRKFCTAFHSFKPGFLLFNHIIGIS